MSTEKLKKWKKKPIQDKFSFVRWNKYYYDSATIFGGQWVFFFKYIKEKERDRTWKNEKAFTKLNYIHVIK